MTGKERRFVDEYLIDLNAYAAALRAGYKPATAKNAASWIDGARPGKPQVREAVEMRMAELSKRTGVTAERVVHELARIAFANATDAVDPISGRVREDADRDDTAAIQSVKVKSGDDFTEREVKFGDKIRALELLGKHLGMFTDVVKVDGAVPVIIDDTGEDDPTQGRIGHE